MSDLISRQAAIDALHMDTSIIPFKKAREYADVTISEIRNRLEKLPSAQPERIKSKWALHTYMPHNKFCLACRNDSPYNKRWDFCPKCGAEMREVTT